jgi:hypothetical protein
VVGEGLRRSCRLVLAADRSGPAATAPPGGASRRLWQVPRFDLLRVHNLVAWEKQLPLLRP